VENVINSSEYVYAYQLLQHLIEFPINILIDANYSIILCNYHDNIPARTLPISSYN